MMRISWVLFHQKRNLKKLKAYLDFDGSDDLFYDEWTRREAELKKEGINARVINMATIKPLDKDIVIKAAKETGAIVTAEEHNVIGGLGGAVSEVICENYPVPVVKLGVEDTFGRSGPAVELLHLYGLDAEHIVAKAKHAIAMKK